MTTPSTTAQRAAHRKAQRARRNLRTLEDRGRQAKESGFRIEAIIARQYIIEFQLRRYVRHHTRRPVPPGVRFEQLIRLAESCHLDRTLARRLDEFRKARNAAVHGLINGECTYADLRNVFGGEDTVLKLTTALRNAVDCAVDSPKRDA